MDRAGVAGGDVAEGVMGRDRDVVGRPGRGRVRVKPETVRVLAPAGLTVMPLWAPVMDPVTVSVAVIDWVPAVLSVTEKTWVPASPPVKV